MTKINDLLFQIMWNRLIAVVEEQAQTLIRTAFSTSVREAGDVSAGVFDRHGRMITQAVTGTPGHVNAMAEAAQHIIRDIGPDNIHEGDVYITNDPWKGTGHLHDITLLTPSFRKKKLVGFFAATAHVIDIGGRGFGPDARELYEEGLFIPIMKLTDRGNINQVLINMVRANVREQRQVVGDVFSLVVCNETGHRRLIDMMDEFAIDDLDDLASFVFSRSREATLEAVNALPRGRFESQMTIDGYNEQVELCVALTIEKDRILADFAGTSGASGYGINVPIIYTRAYACYGLKCAIAPLVPNNFASLSPFDVVAPEGTIVNALRPAPVSARHVIGHMIPDLVLGALHHFLPDRIPAESAGALWNIQISAHQIDPKTMSGGPRQVLMFNSGGTGARAELDGMGATAFPSGVNTMSVEATEQSGPIIVWRKELLPDSGGAGRHRGGLGQRIEIGAADGFQLHFNAMFDRVHNPARGRNGGRPGGAGAVRLNDGSILKGKGRQAVPADARVVLDLPGGGGFGDASLRSKNLIRSDLESEYITREHAREFYGYSE
jgi:N-methylhydantoinase B